MPFSISRLRRWFVIGAVLIVLVVVGAYLYARLRVRNALKEVPNRIGINIQQTASGFTVSRSEQGRTIFKAQASKAIQFRQGGITELHDVAITLYGRDASRFDQIYGSDFEYNPATGDISAKGEVQIDIEANPEGLAKPDQAAPKELKNPIHLKTSGLVFNQKTGNAHTDQSVQFSIPQASGSAVGATYVSRDNVLTLQSKIRVDFHGETPATVTATRGMITKTPRALQLDHPRVDSATRRSTADKATLLLRDDNSLDRVLAEGNVQAESSDSEGLNGSAQRAEVWMAQQHDTIRTATLTGDVKIDRAGAQPIHANAGRIIASFMGKNQVTKLRAEDNVKVVQRQQANAPSATGQDLELTAAAMDAFFIGGRRLSRAETLGSNPQIAVRPAGSAATQQTLVTAGRFTAHFDADGRLASVHGAPNARITTTTPGQADRVTTSATLDVAFRSGTGVESIVQKGDFVYVDGDRKAWADSARYTPSDQMIVLNGSPRVAEAGLTTTARNMRLNRATGDAFADLEVKSTYSELKAQPNGALLASADPIHVTARSMTAHRGPAIATYTGNARLWQNANIIQAPSIQFDRDHRSLIAQAAHGQQVSTVLVQVDKSGKATPITLTSSRLTYTDSERKAVFSGGVVAKGSDATMTANEAEVYLMVRGQQSPASVLPGSGQLDRIIAERQVVITQPSRRAAGDRLVYTAGEDKFVLTGGPPSIFDAEHGKITGVSLTFFRHDDRVLVEGNDTSPTVTQTRVAR